MVNSQAVQSFATYMATSRAPGSISPTVSPVPMGTLAGKWKK